MLKLVTRVSEGIQELSRGAKPFTLETVAKVVRNISPLDEVYFVGLPIAADNPLWGGFTKWRQRPTAYSPLHTYAEIRYGMHLSPTWKRFIVCKELCHALDGDKDSHTVTEDEVDDIVGKFALMSSLEAIDKYSQPLKAELLAEVCALELMCPLRVRRPLVESGVSAAQIAAEYGIPPIFCEALCMPALMDMTEAVFKNA
jgi:hypothetical protein